MKLLKVFAVFMLALSMTGCSQYDKSTFVYLEDVKAVDADMSGYDGFKQLDHVYKKITFKESIRFLDEKATGVVYYGYAGCPYCTQVVPILNDVAKKYDITVYYVDVHGDKINSDDLDYFLSLVDDYVEHDENGEPEFWVPQVFVYVNGEVMGSHIGAVDSYDPAVGIMSNSQKNELTKIFKKMLKSFQ